jgi:ribosomal protein L11 methyltransferase
MPYRIEAPVTSDAALDRLIELGALDVELDDRQIAAVLPDHITRAQVARALGVDDIVVSAAIGRDADSVWILRRRPVRVGHIGIVAADDQTDSNAVRLIETPAFGTGLHPTTALCLEALDDMIQTAIPEAVLDVGTGSGVIALAALKLGIPRALGIDIDETALNAAGENARLNGMSERLQLARGGPEIVTGAWPLVFANILAGPLIEMAPQLVRRVAHDGQLVLSGIPCSIQTDVDRAYRDLGMRHVTTKSRAGWTATILRASW